MQTPQGVLKWNADVTGRVESAESRDTGHSAGFGGRAPSSPTALKLATPLERHLEQSDQTFEQLWAWINGGDGNAEVEG